MKRRRFKRAFETGVAYGGIAFFIGALIWQLWFR